MQRREEEARHRMLIDEIERATGDTVSKQFKERYIKGADELTLVRSGLDDTMRNAYASMRELWHSRRSTDENMDLRTAAYMISIQRVADSYRALGL
jgi:glutamate dehydrogenase (NAD(P)+)